MKKGLPRYFLGQAQWSRSQRPTKMVEGNVNTFCRDGTNFSLNVYRSLPSICFRIRSIDAAIASVSHKKHHTSLGSIATAFLCSCVFAIAFSCSWCGREFLEARKEQSQRYGGGACDRIGCWTGRRACLFYGRGRPSHVDGSMGDNVPHMTVLAVVAVVSVVLETLWRRPFASEFLANIQRSLSSFVLSSSVDLYLLRIVRILGGCISC